MLRSALAAADMCVHARSHVITVSGAHLPGKPRFRKPTMLSRDAPASSPREKREIIRLHFLQLSRITRRRLERLERRAIHAARRLRRRRQRRERKISTCEVDVILQSCTPQRRTAAAAVARQSNYFQRKRVPRPVSLVYSRVRGVRHFISLRRDREYPVVVVSRGFNS